MPICLTHPIPCTQYHNWNHESMTHSRYEDDCVHFFPRPSQKSPVPLNRYEDFRGQEPRSPNSTLGKTASYKMVGRALYNFQVMMTELYACMSVM